MSHHPGDTLTLGLASGAGCTVIIIPRFPRWLRRCIERFGKLTVALAEMHPKPELFSSFVFLCAFQPLWRNFKTLQGFPSRKAPAKRLKVFPTRKALAKRLKVFGSHPGGLVKPSGVWSDGHEA
mgnify:CR=1 FL=1